MNDIRWQDNGMKEREKRINENEKKKKIENKSESIVLQNNCNTEVIVEIILNNIC